MDTAAPTRRWPATLAWALAWAAMLLLDGRLDLANLALTLVLAAAVAALWWPAWLSMAACAVAVLAFNVVFVPPRGSLDVDVTQHALLLATMLGVGSLVTLLVARQRQLVAVAQQHAGRVAQLQQLAQALRDSDDPRTLAPLLRGTLAALSGTAAAVMLAPDGAPATAQTAPVQGTANAEQRLGLWLALQHSQALGPGSGRHEDQPAWYLPLRGRAGSLGAALLPWPYEATPPPGLRQHAQALCDQMGLALERAAALRAASQAREAAATQALHNTLLAAVAHDHRTPLATILGAATALHDQAERLSAQQQRTLAATIADEAGQLARLADNTLQLARLGAPGLQLHTDWESAEELVGTVLSRLRQRGHAQRVLARVEPGLPLLRCDAVLIVQLLDNLVDNALKHTPGEVQIVARRIGEPATVVLAVKDRGTGVPVAERERIFEPFARGRWGGERDSGTRGAGVGLALCRAIASAHGGTLRCRARGRGGSSFECALPVAAQLPLPEPGR
jgi:two-component system, OmpR family, sensor histidine kinase KdpD